MISHLLNDQLKDLHTLLHQLRTAEYSSKSPMLGNISIGQHARHVIEFIQCLLSGYDEGCVNYESRKRDFKLETDRHFAITCIEAILYQVDLQDKHLLLVQENDILKSVNSSYYRELCYNTEHAIHHMALIRVALREKKLEIVNEHFGVAPGTIQNHNKACAQ